MFNCPRCETGFYRKDGYALGRQRYFCKGCGMRYTVKKRGRRVSNRTLRMIIYMYLEGCSFRKISRQLDISQVSISKWLNTFGEEFKLIRKTKTEDSKNIELNDEPNKN